MCFNLTIKTTSISDAQGGAVGKVAGNKPSPVYPSVSTGLVTPLSSIAIEHVNVSNTVPKDSAVLATATSRKGDEERNEFEEEVRKYYYYFDNNNEEIDASSDPSSDSSELAGDVRNFMNLLENKAFELAKNYIKGVITSVTVNNNRHERNGRKGNGTPLSPARKSLSATVEPLRRDNEGRDDIAASGTKTMMKTGKRNGKRGKKSRSNEREGKIITKGIRTKMKMRERYYADGDEKRNNKVQDIPLTKGETGISVETEDRRMYTGERKDTTRKTITTTKRARYHPSLNPWLLTKVRKP